MIETKYLRYLINKQCEFISTQCLEGRKRIACDSAIHILNNSSNVHLNGSDTMSWFNEFYDNINNEDLVGICDSISGLDRANLNSGFKNEIYSWAKKFNIPWK